MEQEMKIINGPYLLGLATSHVLAAWETQAPGLFQVAYGRPGEEERIAAADFEREPSCPENPQGCCLYTAELNDLVPGLVCYRVLCRGEEVARGQFRALPQETEKIHAVTLSDSHIFNASEFFARSVDGEKPDFLIHGGDIPPGTGYQHEHYSGHWFRKLPELLKEYPAFYIPGNHDDGPFFDYLFARPQSRVLHSMADGRNFSFSWGPAFFLFADSNPWGLMEMNAVNAGVELPEGERSHMGEILSWLEDELKSPQARQARWRILVEHHPYTDAFNNKYLIPLAERCGVNLVIGGHLHYFVKAISSDPAVGAGTVYVSQGSAQDAEARLEKSDGESRLLEDFPEVVAMGRNNYGVLDVTKEAISYKLYGFEADGRSRLVDEVRLEQEQPQVEYRDAEIRRLDNNGHAEIRVEAHNPGQSVADARVRLLDNNTEHILNLFGREESSQSVLLEPGETRRLTALYHALQPGEHVLEVGEQRLRLMVFEPSQLSFAHLRVMAGEGAEADCLRATVEATNNLDHELFTSVPLYVNQRIMEAKSIFFRGHEKKFIEFRYKFDQGGNYQVSIADCLPKEIRIQKGIRIIPRVLDKSGCGHTALLHGTPKVVERGGHMEVCLEQYGDYIEVLPEKDLQAEEGFTGMVWAKVERLAREEEMGHNPLMVRGKSVGWGATYFLRMVVERAGGLKWGTCHGITEYSWQGGEAKLGQWAQYTISFDREKGGDSYCDGRHVAHVAGIGREAELRQWGEEPIFIGYSYIGHVIEEIGRPKYFTHLPGRISQVRFYRQGLTAQENKRVLDSPLASGPKDGKLALWLDFRNILKVGTHTTEWRHPAVYAPAFKTEKRYWQYKQLKVSTVLPRQAGLKAVVEVSDDCVSVKGALKLALQDGTHYLDLSPLPEAQYLRIRTEMFAEVGAEGTFVPELQEYQVIATNGNDFADMFWSTRPQWEKGTFTGAAGFAPRDRLQDYPEYTDVIHG